MRNPLSKLTTFFCIVMFVVLASACGGPNSTPTQTLTAYCSALKNADYQTAYNQFSNGIKGLSESQYAALLKLYGKVTNCTPSNVNDSSGSGTINLSFANLGNVVFDYTLVNDNGTWKVKNQTVRSTPSFTLNLYCLALKTGDYQTSYNNLSSAIRSQLTEDQFVAAGSENGTRTVTDCMVSNVDDAAGTGRVTITASNGLVSSQDYALTQENGTWKISALTSTATETLNNFCSALKSEDYQSAFSDLSSTAQSQVGSADQFASSFSSNKVTDCTVSNADDSAGTGTIKYTYADGSTPVFNYTLVNQNNDWLIDSAQQAQ
jgi:ABC-type transporter MlaC component